MKLSCCPIITVFLIVIIGLQIWIIRALPARSLPVSSPTPTPSITLATPTPTPASSPTATPASDSTLLFKRDNISGCSYTANSPFSLKEAHEITKLQTWYSWGSNEITLDYQLKMGDKVIRDGVFLRKDCDPYQKQWCQAVDENLSVALQSGDYEVVADTPRICQNAASDNLGFIFVYGR